MIESGSGRFTFRDVPSLRQRIGGRHVLADTAKAHSKLEGCGPVEISLLVPAEN